MTAPLTPELALAYLDELTVDVRAAVVLGSGGETLAGDASLAARVRELTGSTDGALEGAVRSVPAAAGTLLLAGAPGEVAIAVLAGKAAVLALLEHDLARVAEGLVPPDSPS